VVESFAALSGQGSLAQAAPSAKPLVLRTESLCKRFGGVVAADKLNFGVRLGQFRCIIGPNGAGKSTLFALLCGIHQPDAGRIFFKDTDITALTAFRRVRLGIGLTFQTNRAFHALTVAENLDAARRALSGRRDDHFRYALSAFKLEDALHRAARELPHHQLQWLEICMALRQGPEILLLDEPTAGMSPDETLYTATILRELSATGLTIVVVEHDIAFVREVADSVSVLHYGRMFAEGTVAEITARDDVRQIYLGRT
jgi:branched-chain amino acid transport system ATP-binding protein